MATGSHTASRSRPYRIDYFMQKHGLPRPVAEAILAAHGHNRDAANEAAEEASRQLQVAPAQFSASQAETA